MKTIFTFVTPPCAIQCFQPTLDAVKRSPNAQQRQQKFEDERFSQKVNGNLRYGIKDIVRKDQRLIYLPFMTLLSMEATFV